MAGSRPLEEIKVSNILFSILHEKLIGNALSVLAVTPYDSLSNPHDIPLYLVDAKRFFENMQGNNRSDLEETIRSEMKGILQGIRMMYPYEYVMWALDADKAPKDISGKILGMKIMKYTPEEVSAIISSVQSGEAIPQDLSIVRMERKDSVSRKASQLAKRYGLDRIGTNSLLMHLRIKGEYELSENDVVFANIFRAVKINPEKFRQEYGILYSQYRLLSDLHDFYETMKKKQGNGGIFVVSAQNNKALYVINAPDMRNVYASDTESIRGAISEHTRYNHMNVHEYYKNLIKLRKFSDYINGAISQALSMREIQESSRKIDSEGLAGKLEQGLQSSLPGIQSIIDLFHSPDERSFVYADEQVAAYFRGVYDNDGKLVQKGVLSDEEMKIREGIRSINIGESKRILAGCDGRKYEQIEAELTRKSVSREYINAMKEDIDRLLSYPPSSTRALIRSEAEALMQKGHHMIDEGNQKIEEKVDKKFILKAMEECIAFVKLLGQLGIEYQTSTAEVTKAVDVNRSNLDLYVERMISRVKAAEEKERDHDKLFIEYLAAYKALRYMLHPDIGNEMLFTLERKIKGITEGLDPSAFHFSEEDSFYMSDPAVIEERLSSLDKDSVRYIIKMANHVADEIQGRSNAVLFPNDYKGRKDDIADYIDSIEDANEKVKMQRRLFYLAGNIIDSYLAGKGEDALSLNIDECNHLSNLFKGVKDKVGFMKMAAKIADSHRTLLLQHLSQQSYDGEQSKQLHEAAYSALTDNFLLRVSIHTRAV